MKSVKLMGAALAACALMAGTAFAAPREAAPTAFDPIAHPRVVEVSEQLRCLVCQNQSIADSNAELAVDLRVDDIIRHTAISRNIPNLP